MMVGMDDHALKLAHGIEKHRDLGLWVMGFRSTAESLSPPRFNGFPVLGPAQDLPRLLGRGVVDQVIFAISQEELKQMENLWQVSGRNQIDFNEWMKLDLDYIDNWSLWLDLKILLRTIPVVLSGRGAM